MNTTPKVTIRQFVRDDMLQVSEIERAVFGSGGYHPLYIRQYYDLFPSLIWVAEDQDRRVVGHIFGAIAQGCTCGWILNFAVLPHCRRTGIGQRLLEHAVAGLSKTDVDNIKTTAEMHNKGAMRLYEAVGFKRVGVGANYYGDGTDRAIFERKV